MRSGVGGLKIGDAVVRVDWNNEIVRSSFGIVLGVYPDRTKLKSPFGTPWIYRVLWKDGIIKEHEMGSLRRVIVR